ncbi:transposase [Vibrio parahaemolyticus]|uniref:transposase n=1 Tax=Vibrio parahaemolyticus TaxID=670 RepID=UPI00130136C3|nr:transposase [Vibrio parahaemolyticus]
MSQYIKDKANDFKTVSVIKLPPYSPELNSIEQVWSGLRQRLFSHQSFTDYDSIISKVCDAWNRFLDSSKRVTKISSRRWIDLTS